MEIVVNVDDLQGKETITGVTFSSINALYLYQSIFHFRKNESLLKKIKDLRNEYQKDALERQDLKDNPIEQFKLWWDDAILSELTEPNAMTIATVNDEGQPSARIVLLKGISFGGFEFYTNYHSQKAIEIAANPKVALVFLWKELERQVRIEGLADKLSFKESQDYFQSRPRGNQIGAWSSPQSEIIKSREELEAGYNLIADQFEKVDPLPCPDHWGGYIVKPHLIEFWQGRPNRLHDRFRYLKNNKGENWIIDRLAP